ncbi:fimbrial protein [Citrobacter werkmanii]|uniref:fimbrial protein n=1 Tax=Citrobacter werkmanii TaxID=67827 RepID=UPI0037CAB43B
MSLALSVYKLIRPTIMLMMLISFSSLAVCHVSKSAVLRFNLPDINLPGQGSMGTVLARSVQQLSDANGGTVISCEGNGTARAIASHPLLAGNHIFATGLPGIGYRLIISNKPLPWRKTIQCSGTHCESMLPNDASVELQIIETSAVSPGGGYIPESIYGMFFTDDLKPALIIQLAHRIKVQQKACDIRSDVVNLGHASIRTFPDILSQSEPVDFTVQLTCAGSSLVKMIWEGETDPYGFIRTLPGKTKAQGIGIKLTDAHGKIMSPGKFFSVSQNNRKVHLSASMVRVGKVTPGDVEGLATLHFIYN